MSNNMNDWRTNVARVTKILLLFLILVLEIARAKSQPKQGTIYAMASMYIMCTFLFFPKIKDSYNEKKGNE